MAPSPLPLQLKQERETLEESSISNIPMAMLNEVRVKGLFHLRPFLSPMGIATVVALGPGRIATLRPPPPRERPQRVHLPWGESTRSLHPTEPLALKCPHLVTTPSKRLVRDNEGMGRLLPAPSGAEQHRDLHRHHLCQELPQRPWRGPNFC